MPIRQLADAGAQSTVALPITNSQTAVTVASTTGFPAILSNGQLSVTILPPGFDPNNPLALGYEYQQVNAIAGNVLTFGPGGGAAARSSYAGTTPRGFLAGATIAVGLLAEDLVASVPWKFDHQVASTSPSITIPASGSIPSSYLGVNYSHLEIEYALRGDTAAVLVEMALQFNGDSANHYSCQRVQGNAAAASASEENTLQSSIGLFFIAAANTAPNWPGIGRIWIPLYGTTTFGKMAQILWDLYGVAGTQGTSAGLFTGKTVGQWGSTAAITSVTLKAVTGNLALGTVTSKLHP